MNKKVMCFGTFDLLHLGHIDYFTQAKTHGDHLIVVIARDNTKRKQGKKIIFSETERLQLIGNLALVDEVVLGDEQDHFKIIEEKNPEVIFLGYDHKISKNILVQKFGCEVYRGLPFQTHSQKSGIIRRKILGRA